MPDFPPKTLFFQELMPCVTLFLLGDQSVDQGISGS